MDLPNEIIEFLGQEWSKQMKLTWDKRNWIHRYKFDYMLNLNRTITDYICVRDSKNRIVAAGIFLDRFLRRIIVKDSERGKGYGKRLIYKMLSEIENRPIWVRCDLELVGFYQKFGFDLIDTRLETKNGVYHVHCYMKLEK